MRKSKEKKKKQVGEYDQNDSMIGYNAKSELVLTAAWERSVSIDTAIP